MSSDDILQNTIKAMENGQKLTRSEQKRLDILFAAKTLFLEQGYAAVSVDQIAESASVSKRTLYSHFTSKELLFGHLMSEMCDVAHQEYSMALDPSKPVETQLRIYAEQFLHLIFADDSLKLIRVLMSQAHTVPEMSKEFYINGPAEMCRGLVNYLEIVSEQPGYHVEESYDEAVSFIATLKGMEYFKCLLGVMAPPDDDLRAMMINRAISRLMNSITQPNT